jgi:hypothetical protein
MGVHVAMAHERESHDLREDVRVGRADAVFLDPLEQGFT